MIDIKKGELTIRVGDEAVHFNLNQSLKQPKFDNDDCKSIETIVPINFELKYDCKIQSSMNENEMNFHYIEDVDFEFMNSSFEFKETVLSLKEGSEKNSSICEGKAQEVETSSKELIVKKLLRHLKHAFLEAEKSKPMTISAYLIEHK